MRCRPVVLVPRSERAGHPEEQRRPYSPLHIQPDSGPRATLLSYCKDERACLAVTTLDWSSM